MDGGSTTLTNSGSDPGFSAGDARSEYHLTLDALLRVVRSRLWAIVLVATLVAGAAVGFSLTQTPQYEASVLLLIGGENAVTEDPGVAQSLQNVTPTMAEAVATRPVAEAVISRLDLTMDPDFLLGNLTAERVSETQFIRVVYRDPDPERAQRIADAVGDEFSAQVEDVSERANAAAATVWEEAVVPTSPVSPNPLRDGILGLLVGLMLGLVLAFLLEYLDDRWRSPEEVEQATGVPTFGMIPQFKSAKAGRKKAGKKGERR